jgi:hypothetical protein
VDTVISLITAALALVFTLALLGQFIGGRKSHQLVWAVSLGSIGTASFLQWLWLVGVTGEVVFRLWYLTAVILILVSLATGMALLLLPKGLKYGAIGILLVLTFAAVILDLVVPLRADIAILQGGLLHAKQPGTEASFFPENVEGLTFFLSLIAGLVLIGSAAYLGVLVILKRSGLRRAIPIILVTMGALGAQEAGLVSLIGFGIVLIGLLSSKETFKSFRIPLLRPGRTFRNRREQ